MFGPSRVTADLQVKSFYFYFLIFKIKLSMFTKLDNFKKFTKLSKDFGKV